MRWLQQTLACVAFLYAASSVANTLPDLKLAALKFGTVKWELQTIKRLELDKKNGFRRCGPQGVEGDVRGARGPVLTRPPRAAESGRRRATERMTSPAAR